MINVSDFTKELFAKWYPHDAEPTAEEWKAVPQHFAPVQAVQFVKRVRMVASGQTFGVTRHPTYDEVAAVRVYKTSEDHLKQIGEHNATTLQPTTSSPQSTNGAPRNIQRNRNAKTRRKRGK